MGHADRDATNPGASFREQFLHSGGGVRCQEPTVDIAMDARTLGELKAITGITDGFDANGLGLADACIVGFTALRQAAERWVVPTAQQPEAERVTGRPDIPGARHPAVWGQLPARDGGPACGEAVSLLNCGLPFRGCRSSRGPWLSMGRWPCPRTPLGHRQRAATAGR